VDRPGAHETGQCAPADGVPGSKVCSGREKGSEETVRVDAVGARSTAKKPTQTAECSWGGWWPSEAERVAAQEVQLAKMSVRHGPHQSGVQSRRRYCCGSDRTPATERRTNEKKRKRRWRRRRRRKKKKTSEMRRSSMRRKRSRAGTDMAEEVSGRVEMEKVFRPHCARKAVFVPSETDSSERTWRTKMLVQPTREMWAAKVRLQSVK